MENRRGIDIGTESGINRNSNSTHAQKRQTFPQLCLQNPILQTPQIGQLFLKSLEASVFHAMQSGGGESPTMPVGGGALGVDVGAVVAMLDQSSIDLQKLDRSEMVRIVGVVGGGERIQMSLSKSFENPLDHFRLQGQDMEVKMSDSRRKKGDQTHDV